MLAVLSAVAIAFGSPKLTIRHAYYASTIQPDEFDMAWHNVWSAYFEEGSEFDDFLTYFMENACVSPLKLAVEVEPYGLLVCARKCKDGFVPVLKHRRNGSRVRKCKRVDS